MWVYVGGGVFEAIYHIVFQVHSCVLVINLFVTNTKFGMTTCVPINFTARYKLCSMDRQLS